MDIGCFFCPDWIVAFKIGVSSNLTFFDFFTENDVVLSDKSHSETGNSNMAADIGVEGMDEIYEFKF